MKTILLVQPPIKDFYLTKKRTIPYGLASIGASLLDQGFSVKIFDMLAKNRSRIIDLPENFVHLKQYYGPEDLCSFSLFSHFKHFGYSFDHLAKVVKDIKPFMVGISSLFTAYSNEALKCAKIIKKGLPKTITVLGGHHPTQMPELVIEDKNVDFLIRGEGETSLPILANAILNNEPLKDIPGIVFKNNDLSLHINDPVWIKDLDQTLRPAIHLINTKYYKRNNQISSVIVASRGCPMRCSYCSVSATSSYASFRQKSVVNVIKELEDQSLAGDLGFIDFEDENISLNKKWFLDLLDAIRTKFGHMNIELRAMNGLYPPSLDEEIIIAMKESGFKTLNLSLGSTSKKQLEKFKRNDIRKPFEKVLELAKKHDLETVSYIIAAAPGQNPFQSVDDLLYLFKKDTLAGLSIYYPSPGSLDFQKCREQHLLPEHHSLMRSTALPINDTTTSKQSVTLLRLSRILNFIKSLKNKGNQAPAPKKCEKQVINDLDDKENISQKILSWFLFDGIIRGVDIEGNIFSHNCDEKIINYFLDRFKKL